MTVERTYLDHNATAPLRAEARAAMLDAMALCGNPSSVHAEGRRARALIEAAREQVAALVGARSQQIVFASGATEANNWVVRQGTKGAGWDCIVLAGLEHDSVSAPAAVSGATLLSLPCTADGEAIVEGLDEQLAEVRRGDGSTLIALQLANSETGVLQPVSRAAKVARQHAAVLHTDAVQAAGRVAIDFAALGADTMSLSSHKIGGPAGVGALVISEELQLPALLAGGGQERRRRAGTETVAGIAGFGAAAVAAAAELSTMARLQTLRDRLEAGVRKITPDVAVIGQQAARLPNTVCMAVAGSKATALVINLDLAGIAVGAGSACSSGKIGGSPTLAAMGIAPQLAEAAIRISLGWSTTEADVDRFLAAWSRICGAQARVQPSPSVRDMDARTPERMTIGD